MQFPTEIRLIGVAVHHSTITFLPSAPYLLPVGWLSPSLTGTLKSEKPTGSGKRHSKVGAGHGGKESGGISLEWKAGKTGALISCGQAPRGGGGGGGRHGSSQPGVARRTARREQGVAHRLVVLCTVSLHI